MKLSKTIKDFRQKCKDAEALCRIVDANAAALNTYPGHNPEYMMGIYGSFVTKIAIFEHLEDRIALLHKIFVGIERTGTSVWSPSDGSVISSWEYRYKGLKINIWMESKMEDVPELYKNGILSTTCRFVEEEKKSYSLVCERKE